MIQLYNGVEAAEVGFEAVQVRRVKAETDVVPHRQGGGGHADFAAHAGGSAQLAMRAKDTHRAEYGCNFVRLVRQAG